MLYSCFFRKGSGRMFADCHIHMVLDGQYYRNALQRHAQAPEEMFIRQTLARYRSLGYTYLRDGGDRWGVGERARLLAPEYGITYRTPLTPLCQAGRYGSFIGTSYETLTEYALQVAQIRRQGGDFIKIMIAGLMDFHQCGVLTEDGLPEEQIRQLVHIAHEEGMAVMAHANGARTVEAAAAAGVDSVEHGAYLDSDALSAMAQQGTVWVPTLSTVGNLLNDDRFPHAPVRAILESALENLSRYKGLVAPGTDAGAWAVPHGCCTEEKLLAQAGIGEDRLAQGIAVIQKKFCPPV